METPGRGVEAEDPQSAGRGGWDGSQPLGDTRGPVHKKHGPADCDRLRVRRTAAAPRHHRFQPVEMRRTFKSPDLVTLPPTDRLPSHAKG